MSDFPGLAVFFHSSHRGWGQREKSEKNSNTSSQPWHQPRVCNNLYEFQTFLLEQCRSKSANINVILHTLSEERLTKSWFWQLNYWLNESNQFHYHDPCLPKYSFTMSSGLILSVGIIFQFLACSHFNDWNLCTSALQKLPAVSCFPSMP